MEARTMSTIASQDEQEWELADEELDRTAPELSGLTSTSRPCSCQVCSSPQHCR